jgi:endonuclease YncB( thermonuclease family)
VIVSSSAIGTQSSMNYDPRTTSRGASGAPIRCAPRRGRTASVFGFILITLITAVVLACVGGVQAAKPPRVSTSGAGNPTLPGEGVGTQLWGTVRAVQDAAQLVIVAPEFERLQVRLLGVELPEPPRQGKGGVPLTVGQPFGPEAASYLRDLVVDKQVLLETYGKDRSGRLLAVVWLGNINVNVTLVKEGLAWMSPSIGVLKVRAELEVAERQARVAKYGLWALPNPEAPWEFRKRHRLPVE